MPVSGRIRERRCNNPDATLDRGCGVMTSPRPAHETIPNWPPSNWNGGRDQIGIGGRLRWNPHAVQGVNNSDAVRMAFDEANEKGGVNGRKIKYVVEDSQYQVPRAVQAMNKL